MKILYLFGNGFDLHVGLKTSFHQFLKYYLNQPIPSGLDDFGKRYISRLKDDIQGNIDLWSSLELQYGKHMSQLGKGGNDVHTIEEELDIINDDIREKLSSFIEHENNEINFTNEARHKFLNDILVPEQNLRDYEIDKVKQCRANVWNLTQNVINIITFNYTSTIEYLLGDAPVQASKFVIQQPIHVHGYYNRRMVLGVNDISQIDNENLRNNQYVIDALVKANNNHSYGDNHTNLCRQLIHEAQLICCYGLSFGDTDKVWWKLICDELSRRGDVILIIFAHADKMPNYANSGHKLQNMMRREINNLLSKGDVDNSLKQQLSQRIYVSINGSIFNIKINNVQSSGPLTGDIESICED